MKSARARRAECISPRAGAVGGRCHEIEPGGWHDFHALARIMPPDRLTTFFSFTHGLHAGANTFRPSGWRMTGAFVSVCAFGATYRQAARIWELEHHVLLIPPCSPWLRGENRTECVI